jgi:streptogramin lyase
MNGDAELDAMIARINRIPDLGKIAAPDVARAIEQDLQRTVAAGTTPDGQAWAAKKKGSGQPLANATKALHVAAIGTLIYVRLTGAEALHHLGRVTGKVKRQIIPTGAIPPAMGNAIRTVLARKFSEVMSND